MESKDTKLKDNDEDNNNNGDDHELEAVQATSLDAAVIDDEIDSNAPLNESDQRNLNNNNNNNNNNKAIRRSARNIVKAIPKNVQPTTTPSKKVSASKKPQPKNRSASKK